MSEPGADATPWQGLAPLMAATMTALLSHWRRQPMQLLTLIAGLALATALWSGVQAINAEARASYDKAAAVLDQDRRPTILARDGGGIQTAEFVRLRRAGWPVAPVVEGQLGRGADRLTLLGVDFISLPPRVTDAPASGQADKTQPDPAFYTYNQAFAAPATIARLAEASIKGLPTPRPDTRLPPGTVLTDISVAQTLLERPGAIDRLILLAPTSASASASASAPDPADLPTLASLAPRLRLDAPGDSEGNDGAGLARLTDSFHLNLSAFGLLAFAVGLFIVHGAIGLAMEQRRGVFRTLRALGVPLSVLVACLLIELSAFALLAGGIGVALGYLVAAVLLPDVAATIDGLYGARVSGTLAFRPVWWLSGLAVALLGTLAAAAGAIWRVSRMPVLAAARPRAWAMASRRGLRGQTALALTMWLGAGALAVWGTGLIAGFVLLGLLLLGAALALPVTLDAALRMARRITRRFAPSPLGEWFWADTRQQLPGLSLALMALLLALAANIGVGTMVSSFRQTFTGYLDQRLASELYVSTRSRAEAVAVADWLKGRVDAVLPIWHDQTQVAGRPTEVYGIADHATYRDNWPIITARPQVWDRVAAGTGAVVNEQLWRQNGIAPGDRITLAGTPFTVEGVYSDFGNPEGQILISRPALDRLFPTAQRLRFALRLDPSEVAGLRQDLIRQFGLPAEKLVDQAALKAASLRIFERTFTVTAALNVLTLTVAGFAIFTSLLTLSRMRLPQLAPVWAMGLTRRRLAGIELGRSVLLALGTFALAVPLGLMLAWVLLAVVNVAAFGWRLPMQVFPRDWAVLLALAVVAALLAAAIPVRRLARTPPSAFLQVFAHER